MSMSPNLKTLELFGARNSKLLGILLLLSLFIYFKESFGNHDCTVGNSCDLGSQEMSLLAWEGRIAVYCCVEVACQDMLYHPCYSQLFRFDVWELNPVFEKAIRYPVNKSIYSLSPLLLEVVRLLFFLSLKHSFDYPVVLLGTVYLPPEPES